VQESARELKDKGGKATGTPTGRESGKKTRNMSRFSSGDVPVFADIDDVDSVYRLAVDLKEKARKESNSAIEGAPT
jgi:hypothetical protein